MKQILLTVPVIGILLLGACSVSTTTPEAKTPSISPSTEQQTYTLSISISPSGAGSVFPSSGQYVPGLQVILTATADSGYTFDYWDGDTSGSSPAVTITMNSDKNAIAHFRTEQPTPEPTPPIVAPAPDPEPTKKYYLYSEDRHILLESDIIVAEELQDYFAALLRAYEIIEDFFGTKHDKILVLELAYDASGQLNYYIGGKPSGYSPPTATKDPHSINMSTLCHEMTHWYRRSLNVHDQQWFDEGLANYIGYLTREENPNTYNFTNVWKENPQPEWYQRMKNGENLFDEIPRIKDAHKVGVIFFIGLETDYGFDCYKVKDMTRGLVDKRYELGRRLDAYDIKEVAEGIAGQSLNELYDILAPGIEWNAYYSEN